MPLAKDHPSGTAVKAIGNPHDLMQDSDRVNLESIASMLKDSLESVKAEEATEKATDKAEKAEKATNQHQHPKKRQEEQQHEQNVQQFQQEHTHPQSIVAKHRANPTEQLAAPASEQTSEERQQQPQQFNLPQDAHPHGAIHQHPAPQRHANMPTEPMPLNATGSGHWAAAPPKCPLMTKLSTSSASRFQELPNTVALAPGVERIDPEVVRELLRNRECVLIDVRGDDRSSGTIEGATHVPAIGPVPFTARIPEHVQLWQSQQLVIFHCQYSAHRNPPVRELVSGAGC
jgi:hypothetical protein